MPQPHRQFESLPGHKGEACLHLLCPFRLQQPAGDKDRTLSLTRRSLKAMASAVFSAPAPAPSELDACWSPMDSGTSLVPAVVLGWALAACASWLCSP